MFSTLPNPITGTKYAKRDQFAKRDDSIESILDLVEKQPLSLTTNQDLFDTFIGQVIASIPPKTPDVKRKRQVAATEMMVPDYIKQWESLCPRADQVKANSLQDFLYGDVLLRCLGVLTFYCQSGSAQCRDYYDRFFSGSCFSGLNSNCPAWQKGPSSEECISKARSFSCTLPYIKLEAPAAKFFVANLYNSPVYAPCSGTCNWPRDPKWSIYTAF
jgi:hypothetical protein